MDMLTSRLADWARPGLARIAAESASHMALADGARLLVIGAGLAADDDADSRRLDVTRLDLGPMAPPDPNIDAGRTKPDLIAALTALPFRTGWFQGVVYPVPVAAAIAAGSLAEAARVLVPDGYLAVGMGTNPETPSNGDATLVARAVGLIDSPGGGAVRAAILNAGFATPAEHPAVPALRDTLHAVANKLQIVSMMRDMGMPVPIPEASIDRLFEALLAFRADAKAGRLDFRLLVARKAGAVSVAAPQAPTP